MTRRASLTWPDLWGAASKQRLVDLAKSCLEVEMSQCTFYPETWRPGDSKFKAPKARQLPQLPDGDGASAQSSPKSGAGGSPIGGADGRRGGGGRGGGGRGGGGRGSGRGSGGGNAAPADAAADTPAAAASGKATGGGVAVALCLRASSGTSTSSASWRRY